MKSPAAGKNSLSQPGHRSHQQRIGLLLQLCISTLSHRQSAFPLMRGPTFLLHKAGEYYLHAPDQYHVTVHLVSNPHLTLFSEIAMNAGFFNYRMVDGREGFTTPLNAICRLRYQVYVNECGFEKPEDHPGGLEKDEYDQHSIHFYASPKHSDDVIGAARIILGSERPLPIERHFEIDHLPSGLLREQSAEISRLAVSKEFRCRTIERAFSRLKQVTPNHMPPSMDNVLVFRRHIEQELVRGLYVSLYRDSKLRGLTHWFAVMAKGLHVILKRWGINFVQIGPARDYHGIRAPYLISIEDIESSLERNNPALYGEAQYELLHECA